MASDGSNTAGKNEEHQTEYGISIKEHFLL